MNDSGKIIFVDDDLNFLEALRRFFRRQFLFDTVTSGRDALDLLENKGPYAVIVVDLDMPGMNGLELLAKVSTVSPSTVQIVLTGQTDMATFVQAVEKCNIFRYVAKSCDGDALRQALIDGLARYHSAVTDPAE